MDIGKWDVDPDANQQSSPDGWPEGQTKPSINNSGREVMAAIARWLRESPEWRDLWASPQSDNRTFTVSKVSDTQFKITANPASDETGYFSTDLRIRLSDGSTTVFGRVVSATYGSPDTTVTVALDSGVVPAAVNSCKVHLIESLRLSALTEGIPLIQGTHTIPVQAAAMLPTESQGCVPWSRKSTTGLNPEICGLSFQDAQQATGYLVLSANPTNGLYIVLNGVTWTFVTGAPVGNQTQIQGSKEATVAQLVSDLNGSADTDIDDATYAVNGTTLYRMDITHDAPGFGGNSFDIDIGTCTGYTSAATLAGGTEEQYASFEAEMPPSWDGGTIQAEFRAARSDAAVGTDAVFGICAAVFGDGDDMDISWGTTQWWDPMTFTTAEYTYLSGQLATPITPGGSPTGDVKMVKFRIVRDPLDASDDLDVDAILQSVRLSVGINASSDD